MRLNRVELEESIEKQKEKKKAEATCGFRKRRGSCMCLKLSHALSVVCLKSIQQLMSLPFTHAALLYYLIHKKESVKTKKY